MERGDAEREIERENESEADVFRLLSLKCRALWFYTQGFLQTFHTLQLQAKVSGDTITP